MSDPTQPVEVFRRDYRPYPFAVDRVELDFELGEESTVVRSRIELHRTGGADEGLFLDGEDLELRSVRIDGTAVDEGFYKVDGEGLTLPHVPDAFVLEIEAVNHPKANTQLSGLYTSGGMFCTQCEALGFRRITFFPDRPDVMTRFRVRLAADRERFPVLLSNGNRVEARELDDGRHEAVWDDPFPKPSYLFALVAGDLGHVHGTFTTMGGREVDLFVWSEHDNVGRLAHALRCLRSAMAWDEEVFGREYDLDLFNIVAVNDFNMGAMENKSLNVFNAARVLASPETATDDDFEVIDGVIAHEYFHNWTGNRVTCRDWFQLTLKEGLTVLRDQLYSADVTSEAVKRIDDVRMLRSFQFPEDAGPTAHPIRPESYIAMDNFYTATVYEKGAEVLRMIRTLVGMDGFRKGMDLYFERHDGQAVTCDDFRAAMAAANDVDLDQFERWYAQAGTPAMTAEGAHDADQQTYTLTLTQSCPPTPGQQTKEPFHMPVAVGLLGSDGSDLIGTRVLELREAKQRFVFEGIGEPPVPSLLRGFSAPVKLTAPLDDAQLAFLMAHDSDPFNRWEAGQVLYSRVALRLVGEIQSDAVDPAVPEALVVAFGELLTGDDVDPSLRSFAMGIPGERTLGDSMLTVDPDAIHSARRLMARTLAADHEAALQTIYRREAPRGPYRYSPAEAGRRRLRNASLGYLSALGRADTTGLCVAQLHDADNMTDEIAALHCLARLPGAACDEALAHFYTRWNENPLVLDKWFSTQAGALRDDALERVDALLGHPDFDPKNPNRFRALVRTFSRNQPAFHRPDGEGYRWLADRVRALDPLNPQVAARTAEAFAPWRRFDDARQGLMRGQLERIAERNGISKNLYEIVTRCLAG
jgi:aminopeptidase N